MQATQPRFVLGNALGEAIQYGRFLLHRLQQEMAQASPVQGVEVVGGLAAFRGRREPLEMKLGDAGKNRLGGTDGGVLADDDGAAKRRLIGFVAGRLHASGAQRTAAEEVLQLVEVERLLVGAIGFVAVALDQHHRHPRHLAHKARAACRGRFGRVKALVAGAA
ncbi:hypothetical protein D9M69_619040 [compost metagenome]